MNSAAELYRMIARKSIADGIGLEDITVERVLEHLLSGRGVDRYLRVRNHVR